MYSKQQSQYEAPRSERMACPMATSTRLMLQYTHTHTWHKPRRSKEPQGIVHVQVRDSGGKCRVTKNTASARSKTPDRSRIGNVAGYIWYVHKNNK
ncbi:hypothetical protein M404DRAFT_1006305 [Pisolithus tinctorius Marx 270]|uniref:Uncharacterized protein n=1 Tax=Pisolithus tinctorius Marx 270 TaxID=870435 RepID=A0A0C3NN19_PISTI|nr:hypothetical protein M404DRAFT_1006305 [Pisolithus tinctorius Marx 270]